MTLPSCTSASCSLTHALFTLRSVLLARSMPCTTASSKLFVDAELISTTLATDIVRYLLARRRKERAGRRHPELFCSSELKRMALQQVCHLHPHGGKTGVVDVG